MSFQYSSPHSGLTMIELLVALVILSILMLTAVFTFSRQRDRGFDVRRKADLRELQIKLEDYYADKKCYPSLATMKMCNSNALAPYLPIVPCDPVSKLPYGYVVNGCKWYGIFTTLAATDDPVIKQAGCYPTCGVTGQTFNYVIKSQNVLLPAVRNAFVP